MKSCLVFVVGSGLSQLKWRMFKKARRLADLNALDEASRGPEGSLKLFWKFQDRNILSYIGAMTILAAVILDPFAQQLVSQRSDLFPLPDSVATIPRTTFFSDHRKIDSGRDLSSTQHSMSLDLQNAFHRPLYSAATPQVPPYCPSGTCDFPEFYTLAYCGECQDASDQVVVRNSSVTQGFDPTPQSDVTSHVEGMRQLVNFTMPANGTSDPEAEADTSSDPYKYIPLTLSYDSGPDAPFNDDTTIRDSSPSGFLNATMKGSKDYSDTITFLGGFLNGAPWNQPNFGGSTCPSNHDDWSCRGYGAARCSLKPCIQRIKSSVSNNTLKEDVQSQTYFYSQGEYDVPPSTVANVSCLWKMGWGNTSSSIPAITHSNGDEVLTVSTTAMTSIDGYDLYGLDSSMDQSTLDDRYHPCIYSLGSVVSLSISDLNYRTYTGVMSVDGLYDPTGSPEVAGAQNWNTNNAKVAMSTDQYQESHESVFLTQLFLGGQLTATTLDASFKAVAHSVSAYMRSNGEAGGFSDPALGTEYAYHMVYAVKWAWLSYLVAVMVLGLSFIVPVAVILFRDGYSPEQDWKGSILPLLLYGLEGKNDQEVKRMQLRQVPIEDIEELCKRKWVALEDTSHGLKFA